MKSDNRDQSYAQKTGPQVINSFAPKPAADDRPTDITLRSRAALRVMWTTDVRQHTILVDVRDICWHQRAVHMEISRFHNFSQNWESWKPTRGQPQPCRAQEIQIWWKDYEILNIMNYWY